MRRRLIRCPNYCSVLVPLRDVDDDRVEKSPWDNKWVKSSWLIFLGDGDDNAIYKLWNKYIDERRPY